jgi:membrane protein DedA with SNARE-associated domain
MLSLDCWPESRGWPSASRRSKCFVGAPPEHGVFEWITSVIEQLGYLGVATLTFLENLFPPIPSEFVIPLAGFVAAQGDLRLSIVIVMGSVGSLAGATVWYVIGKRVGEERLRKWVGRHGKWLTLSEQDVDGAQRWFRRHGATAVLFGRLIPGVRTFVSLPAGFSSMPLVPFLTYSALGTAIWTAALAYAGVLLQANFTLVADYINLATNGLLALGGIMLVRRYIRCWKAAGDRSHHQGQPEQTRGR